VRGKDGKLRQLERVRTGRTPAAAATALRVVMVEMQKPQGPRGQQINQSTSVRELAEFFLESKRQTGRAPRTVATYDHHLRSIILKRLGDLRLMEVTPDRLQEFLWTVAEERGPGAAKGCRSVLSGMLGAAVRYGAIPSNPVSAMEPIRQPRLRASTALPLDGVPAFLATISADEELRRLDLPDLFAFMLFTGCRIGEALALRWSHVDLDGPKVTFAATVVRVRGSGLRIQEHGKTESSRRTITVPAAARELLERRPHDTDLVFPSMRGLLRDTSNTEADWRANRERLGYPTLTSHALRKTCATQLDVRGASARAIAEYLGHKRPSMTQDVYMARNVGSAAAAAMLDDAFTLAVA
jgi:integrase